MKKSGSTGTLKIGAGITIGTSLLPELLIRFRQKHPDFKISALIKNYSAIEEALLSNEIDFALIEGSPSSSQFIEIPFMKDRLCLVCGASHPLALKKYALPGELFSYDFLMRETCTPLPRPGRPRVPPSWEVPSRPENHPGLGECQQ